MPVPSFHEKELLHVGLQGVKFIYTAKPQADNDFSFLNLIPKEGGKKQAEFSLKEKKNALIQILVK